ncbi:MAG: hypothetical protein U0836_11980 [Pirellulales bacterium]
MTTSRRRWLRFSLQALLVLLTAVCVLLGLVAQRMRRGVAQKRTVAAILAAGGHVAYSYQLDERGNETPDAEAPIPAWLLPLGLDTFFHVTAVHVDRNADLTPERRARLCEGFRALPHLRDLQLYDIDFTEANFACLRFLVDLESLSLDSCTLKDAWIEHLPKGGRLKHLNCDRTAIGDDGLAHLAGQSGLTALSVRSTFVTDEGLGHLLGLPLEDLDLSHNAITDRGLGILEECSTLHRLLIGGGPGVSDEAVRALTIAVPGLAIPR